MKFSDSCYFGHCAVDDPEASALSEELYCDCGMNRNKFCQNGIDIVRSSECQYSPAAAGAEGDITMDLIFSALPTDCAALNDDIQETNEPPEVLLSLH